MDWKKHGVLLSLVLAVPLLVFFVISLVDADSPSAGKVTEPYPFTERISPAAKPNLSFASLPLHFESNEGQFDPSVRFMARGQGTTFYLRKSDLMISVRPSGVAVSSTNSAVQSSVKQESLLRFSFVDANPLPAVKAVGELPGKANYFLGNDPSRWRTNVHTFARVVYQEVYHGIDMAFYGNRSELEYDFIVKPGADPSVISLSVEGAEKIEINRQGDLVIHTMAGDLIQRKPLVYQMDEGKRREVAGDYVMIHEPEADSNGRQTYQVALALGVYDKSLALVIDPVLAYSTTINYATGQGRGIAVDRLGCAYVAGTAVTSGLQVPVNNYLTSLDGINSDILVVKLSADGSHIVYSSVFGGAGVEDLENVKPIAVDTDGSVALVGWTRSANFPTVNAMQDIKRADGNNDAFVTKLNPSGSQIVFSTYLGGDGYENGRAVAIDSSGGVYVAGLTAAANFPLVNALQTTHGGGAGFGHDAFIARIPATGGVATCSTYWGGSGDDTPFGLDCDSLGNVALFGDSGADGFPLVNALYPNDGNAWGFITKFSSNCSSVVFSTRWPTAILGGAMDAGGNAFITGYRGGSIPTTNAVQTTPLGGSEAYVTKFSADGSRLIYSTYLSSSGEDWGSSVAVDEVGAAYVLGYTTGANFPLLNAVQIVRAGHLDWFVTRLLPSGALSYSTLMGGANNSDPNAITVDRFGNAYVLAGSAVVTKLGLASIAPTATLSPLGGPVGDQFGVRVNGSAGAGFVLQASPDLSSWTSLSTNILPSGNLDLSAPAGGSGASFYRGLVCVIAEPEGLNAVAGDGQVMLTWNPVPGASSYNVYLATTSGIKRTNYNTLSGGARRTGALSPMIVNGLANGQAYFFVVTAIADACESLESNQAAATPTGGGGGSEPIFVPSFQSQSGCYDPFTGASIVNAQTLVAVGGAPLSGYTWSLANGSTFPPGTTVEPLTGIFKSNGAAVVPGNYTFTMVVSDGSRSGSGSFTFTVDSESSAPVNGIPGVGCGAAFFQYGPNFSLSDAEVGVPYGSSVFVTVGGASYTANLPLTWSVGSGSLPPGLVLDAARGVVRGTPTGGAGQAFSFTISIRDSAGAVPIGTPSTYTITVN